MRTVSLTLLILTTLFQGASTTDVEILTPPPYTSVTADHFHIIGTSKAPLVEVFLNDLKYGDIRVVDSLFHTRVDFGYGLNIIEIRPIFSGQNDSLSRSVVLEVLSGPKISKRLKKLYPKYSFHNSGEKTEMCDNCHSDLPTNGHRYKGASECLSCHPKFASRELLHGTMENEQCATCHTVGLEQGGGSVVSPCYTCHPEYKDMFNREYIHGPVAGESCGICHDPHGSENPKGLVKPIEVLCYSCHEFSRELKNRPIQHPPFETGKCTKCHDPHSTNNRWVLIKRSETVCFQCHDPNEEPLKNHIHPYDVKPKRKWKTSLELSDQGKLECLTCHNPHASFSGHLLRSEQSNSCLGCHQEKL